MQQRLISYGIIIILILSFFYCKKRYEYTFNVLGNVQYILNDQQLDTIYVESDQNYYNYNSFINYYDTTSSYLEYSKTVMADSLFYKVEINNAHDISFLNYYVENILNLKYSDLYKDDSVYQNLLYYIKKSQFNFINYYYDISIISNKTELNNYVNNLEESIFSDRIDRIKEKEGIDYAQYYYERNSVQLKVIQLKFSKEIIDKNNLIFLIHKEKKNIGKDLIFYIKILKIGDNQIFLKKEFINPFLYSHKYFNYYEAIMPIPSTNL